MEKTIYDISPHTIFMLVGPSGCGKTYFSKNILIPKLEALKPLPNREKVSINYISSDDIRRTLLGQPNFDKYHQGMLAASKGAFEVLYCQLNAVTSFPINSEFVIVDTKGTNEAFREKVLEIAAQNHYNVAIVLFNYKKYDDYKKYSEMSRFTQKDIKKIREISGSGLKRLYRVNNVISIKTIDFDKINFDLTFSKHESYRKCFVSNDREILIVGDVHGCYDEFVELLAKNDIEVKDHLITRNEHSKLIVVNGDYIDKGPKVLDMIEFCYCNLDNIVITKGNHENRLYKELFEGLEHISEEWFNTYDFIDDKHKEMFKKVFESSLPFVMNDKFVATHAPCSVKYLAKIDNKSQSKQRYYKQEDTQESLFDELSKINVFAGDLSNITHVFGHIQTSTPGYRIKGRVLADGACVIGGSLVGIEIGYTGKTYTKSVWSKQPKEETLNKLRAFIFKNEKDFAVDYESMSDKELARIRYMALDKINFISGTMSPCDKFDNQLESIDSAINFFKSKNIREIVMQPKYMGSRMNMYLFETNEESYGVSRNGFKVKIEIDSLFDKMRDRLNIDWEKVKLVIIDGECMPWSAMGEDLVKEFWTVNDCVKAENEFLKETGFETLYSELIEKLESSDFNSEKNKISKKELTNKYGNSQYETFKVASDYKEYINVDEKENMRKVYNEQLHLYGDPGDLDYKPFAILKIVYKDGTEKIPYKGSEWTNESMFNTLNSDGCHKYDLSSDEDIEKCKAEFEKYTTVDKYEGVVIKPNALDVTDIPPFVKVRNPKYLTIVYGFDYTNNLKYEKLYERKSIAGKMRLSMIEWKQGLKMLEVPYDSINEDNEKIKGLYAKFIIEDKKSEGFDPRL